MTVGNTGNISNLPSLRNRERQERTERNNIITNIYNAMDAQTLENYFENAGPDVLKKISKHWYEIRYVEILQECNAKVAKIFLAHITADKQLVESYAIKALEPFNTDKRLPVFIDALRAGREDDLPAIHIDNLLLLHEKTGLPKYVHDALQIESNHRPGYIDAHVQKLDEEEKKAWELAYEKKHPKSKKTWNLFYKNEKQAQLDQYNETRIKELAALEKKFADRRKLFMKDPHYHADLDYKDLISVCKFNSFKPHRHDEEKFTLQNTAGKENDLKPQE